MASNAAKTPSQMYLKNARILVVLFLLLTWPASATIYMAWRLGGNQIEPVTREVYLMGTIFKATSLQPDREKGVQELEKLIRVVEETEDQLSTWRATSELTRLNSQDPSQPFEASPSLCVLMNRLFEWVTTTRGAFDPTVGILLKLWGVHDAPRVPDEKAIRKALAKTGFANLHMAGCKITKTKTVLLDAGAFGKGEALDRALEIAEKNDYAPLLLDFGGQFAAWKVPPSTKAWEISIADPVNRFENSSLTLSLRKGSLSTSSGSVKDRIVEGRRVSHILDPRTGYPAESFGSVTVWHPRALEADILSTALYVMGPREGYRWALEKGIAACFLISEKSRTKIRKTPQFDALVND